MRRRLRWVAALCAVSAVLGSSCSSSDDASPDGGVDGGDAGTDGARDGTVEPGDDAADGANDGPIVDAGPDCGPLFDGAADPSNCGECGHDCRGAACAAGLCAPTTLKTGIPYAMSLKAKNGTVFYAAPNEAHMFPDDGGPEKTTAPFGCGGGLGFNYDTSAAYYMCSVGEGTVLRLAFGGGGPLFLEDAGGTPIDIDVDDSYAYWGNDDGQIHRTLKTGGGSGTTMLTEHSAVNGAPRQMQLRDGYLYWREIAPVLRRIAVSASSAPTPLALVTDDTMRAFYVDDAHIYYTTTTGDVKRVDLDGSNPVTLVAGDGATRLDAVFADAAYVYWTTEHGLVRRALKTDGSHVLTIASSGIGDASLPDFAQVGVVSSGAWVYYLVTDKGILFEVPR